MSRKLTPYNIIKGLKYLKHFGLKEFAARLQERMEPEEVPYGPWYEEYKPSQQELEAQRRVRWKDPVVFSIAVPLFNTPEPVLSGMIESVRGQTYPFWQLCLADAGTSPATLSTARKFAQLDERIVCRHLSENAGIAQNTNAAAAMASGSWICFLDHDDLLSPAALFEVALFLKDHPGILMVYSDEDKIDTDGKIHFQPNLKPDFNPDLLCSNNYICHFLCMKKELFDRIGGVSGDYNGAQDYDLIFRAAEAAGEKQVGHVPEILYHWRTSPSSTADNPMSKMYAYEAGKRAIEDHRKRIGCPGEVSLKKDFGFYRVRYPVQKEELVSIIIPNRNEKATLEKCLNSVLTRSTYRNFEILVVENNSTDSEIFDYYSQIDGRPVNPGGTDNRIRVLTWDKGFNYSAINNFAVRAAHGTYLLFLNNDTEVITPDWMEELLGLCQRPGTGAAGARLYYPNDTVQSAGIVVGIGGIAGSLFVDMKRSHSGYLHKADLCQDLSAVTAACVMIKRSVFENVQGFDERLSVAFNDVDLCLRINESGQKVVFTPYAELYHYESKSRGTEDSKEKVRRFQSEIELMRTKWEKLLKKGDPYYNKNLSLTKWNYSLRSGAHMKSV